MPPNNEVTLRVLIADDDPEMRRGARLMMSLVPNTRVVAMARDGQEALEMVKVHRPHVALMDINMPGTNGLEAIRAMRQLRQEPICIIISAERDAPTVKKAVQAGVVAYLIKPFTFEELSVVMEKTRAVIDKARRRKSGHTEQRRRQLEALAEARVKARRTDDKTIAVLEALAAYPDCPLRWLVSLAMIYVMRQKWRKLKLLAGYLEKCTR
jgi:YesN/AraC family two-component response regulator